MSFTLKRLCPDLAWGKVCASLWIIGWPSWVELGSVDISLLRVIPRK